MSRPIAASASIFHRAGCGRCEGLRIAAGVWFWLGGVTVRPVVVAGLAGFHWPGCCWAGRDGLVSLSAGGGQSVEPVDGGGGEPGPGMMLSEVESHSAGGAGQVGEGEELQPGGQVDGAGDDGAPDLEAYSGG